MDTPLPSTADGARCKIVMFTGAGGAASEAIYRQWADRYDLRFADADIQTIPSTIPPDRKVAIPRADAVDFVDALVAICQNMRIDVLAPGVDEELPFMAEIARRLPNTDVLAPSAKFVTTMLDKLTCIHALKAHGLDTPATVTADQPGMISYPCIVKPRQGRGSRNVMVLDTEARVAAYLTLLELSPDEVVLQERLVGDEYTVYVAADAAGGLRSIIPFIVRLKRGVTIRAEIDMNPEVIAYCEALHAAFNPSGLYNVQLILTSQGRVAPFEINPRLSTTFCLAIATGADPIADYRQDGSRQLAVPRLGLRRYWYNSISELQDDQHGT